MIDFSASSTVSAPMLMLTRASPAPSGKSFPRRSGSGRRPNARSGSAARRQPCPGSRSRSAPFRARRQPPDGTLREPDRLVRRHGKGPARRRSRHRWSCWFPLVRIAAARSYEYAATAVGSDRARARVGDKAPGAGAEDPAEGWLGVGGTPSRALDGEIGEGERVACRAWLDDDPAEGVGERQRVACRSGQTTRSAPATPTASVSPPPSLCAGPRPWWRYRTASGCPMTCAGSPRRRVPWSDSVSVSEVVLGRKSERATDSDNPSVSEVVRLRSDSRPCRGLRERQRLGDGSGLDDRAGDRL
jgi:hypothetical protein